MLALALLLFQGPGLDLSTSLDRARVAVGEEFTYTLHAIGHSTAPFRVELPAFDGLALVERSERTDVVVGTAQVTRAYTLELRLRAEQVGTWSIGPIRVEHGITSAFSAVETVSVSSASSGGGSGMDPDLMALIPRVPPPRLGRPSVYLIASDDKLFAGDQVNVLTAAWLPRGLRLRLRQAPTLTPPSLAGVWTTPRHSVPGAVVSREFEGETYDLYVSLQTAYPLNAGPLTVPPARLGWVEPSGRQSVGEERRESVESAPLLLSVKPLPDAGRPPDFDGPVARGLSIDYELGSSSGRAGVALPVTIVVSGAGNLPLWSPPRTAWPPTVRVYTEGTEGTPRLQGARMGGSKRFRFGVVPDSAGSLSLPALEYAYFDPASASYRFAHTPAIVVPVLEAPPVTDQRNPLPIEEPAYRPFAERLLALPAAALGALVLLPIVLIVAIELWRRRPRRQPVMLPPGSAAERLEALVLSLTPPGTDARRRSLIAALRSAGVEGSSAEQLVRLHLALEADRFGPDPRESAAPALVQEVETALAGLPRKLRRAARLALLLLALPPGSRDARAQSGIELYGRGEYAAAAHAFEAEVSTDVPTSGRFYDLAAAEYLARRDANAVAALLPARALAPRDPRVRLLWAALAREHEQLRHLGRAWPFSAEECLALALGGLWLGALLYLVSRRTRSAAALVLGLALVLAIAGMTLRAQRHEARAILSGGASLRFSPHGLAPERGALPAFSVVKLERREGDWWLVESDTGAAGWVPEAILAVVPALN